MFFKVAVVNILTEDNKLKHFLSHLPYLILLSFSWRQSIKSMRLIVIITCQYILENCSGMIYFYETTK